MFYYGGEGFRPLPLPESEEVIEYAIIENQEVLFPGFIVLDKKMMGKTEAHGTLNDLILVSKNCEQWFIIEVERKNDRKYVQDHIHPQLHLQSTADWSRIIPDCQKALVEDYNFKAETAMKLGENDPGLILIIPKSTPAIDKICRDLDVDIIETEIWVSASGEYGISISKIEQIPELWGVEQIVLHNRDWGRVLKELSFRFPTAIREEIASSEKAMLYIDGVVHVIGLGFNEAVKVPISDDKASDTFGLNIGKFDAVFTKDYSDGILHLTYERTDSY
ncbi:MAG: hypothetical protein ACJZ6A_00070 [Candidatus Poseidoniaceae archaeon]